VIKTYSLERGSIIEALGILQLSSFGVMLVNLKDEVKKLYFLKKTTSLHFLC
jgi:hypothetical protein